MKAAVILFFLVAYFQVQLSTVSARAIEDVQELEPDEEACVDELHLNKNEIKIINSQDIAPDNNLDFNKFIGCYYQRMGWQDAEGEINYDNFKVALEDVVTSELKNEDPVVKMFVRQMMLGTVKECQNNPPPKGNTPGQTAVRVQNCIIKKLDELINEE